MQKVEGPKRLWRENLSPRMSAALRLADRTLKYGFREVLSTLSVTTYHPMGWSWEYFKERIEIRFNEPRAASLDVQLHSPIMLVHGISHNSSAFYKFKTLAKKRGFRNINTLELYTTLQDLNSMSQKLIDQVKRQFLEHQESYGPGKVRIIAHSLGGMVLRAALLRGGFEDYVDRIIFLGVPHQGNFLYNFPVFPALKDLTPNAALMKKIKATPLPGGIEYWNIRGMLDVVTPARDTFLPSVPNLSFINVGHAGMLRNAEVLEAVLNILQEDGRS